jgi:hypothetical protein
MSKPEPLEKCRCGREPEVDKMLSGYAASFHCKCGGKEVNFISRGKSKRTCTENWNDLILRRPLRNDAVRTSSPEEIPAPRYYSSGLPPRRNFSFHGGPCARDLGDY